MTVLHLTDCTPVSAAIGSGSKNSKVLHAIAVRLWRLAATWSTHIESEWIPGTTMLDEGVDRLSREAAIDTHDVRVTEQAWLQAQQLAREGGMQLSVDWFADANNHRLPTFWAKEHAAGATGINALSAATWGRTECTTCKTTHDHGAWVFAPIPLMNKVVAKLRADRAHGVALVPYRPDTVWWTALEHASVGQGAVVSMTKDMAVDTTALAKEQSMYNSTEWKLCRFSFDSDQPWVYPVRCQAPSRWSRPVVSPEQLDHGRRLQALLIFQDKEGLTAAST
jgi:hypothetical protein